MKTIARLGKLLATLFWCVVLSNLIFPFAQPFAQLLNMAGLGLLGLHLAELALFKAELAAQPHPVAARAKVLAFGIFHIGSLPGAAAEVEAVSTSVNVEEVTPCAS